MKSNYCLFLTLLITLNCFSQEQATDINNITKITFLNPGISYETRIAKFQSVFLHAFMNTLAQIGFSDALGNTSSIFFDPSLAVHYRYYYNAKKRASKEKQTENNNLNYLSFITEVVHSKMRISSDHIMEENKRPITKAGIAWGIQRNYKSHFSLDFHVGLGYLFTKATTYDFYTGNKKNISVAQPTTLVQINLGFWLNKRK
ncbi:MAG TPA: DUF3575 domain-containing protein [Chitinophagaceae bacterium]|jgi:hypothetical protein|nr:DUF3575 domain-containing protein [Chitinophagaceae bacterium]